MKFTLNHVFLSNIDVQFQEPSKLRKLKCLFLKFGVLKTFYWQMFLQVSYFRCGFRTEELSGENVRRIYMDALMPRDFQWQLLRDIISRHILLPWRLRLTFLLEIILIHVSLHLLFIQLFFPISVTLALMKLAINDFFLL